MSVHLKNWQIVASDLLALMASTYSLKIKKFINEKRKRKKKTRGKKKKKETDKNKNKETRMKI